MAGGTFITQNKVRPGAYINFKAVPTPLSSLGSRGVVTMPVAMAWGDTITELYSTDLIDGKSLSKIGYTAFDEESQIFREVLKNAYKVIVYRLDTGGVKASNLIGNLNITAKYAGVVGNSIKVSSVSTGDFNFDIITYFKGVEKDRQNGATVDDLEDNEWVVFSGDGSLSANAGVELLDGENGTVSAGTYTDYFNAIESYKWNVLAIPQNAPSVTSAVITLIENLRENVGRKVQAVLYNATADYEGIITTTQGYKTETETITPETFVSYFAGLTAGANVNQSNTYHAINGAIGIEYVSEPYSNEDIESRLKDGEIVLSTRQDGVIVIEQDINTLTTFKPNKSYAFSKNRVIRTLDEINNSISLLFEKNYIGKVANNEGGRANFKADIISYLSNLEKITAIQNFNSETDVEIFSGESIDSVVVNLAIQPVDSMEKLYMTVTVG